MRQRAWTWVLLAVASVVVAPGEGHAGPADFWRQVDGCASWLTVGVDGEVYTVGCDGSGNGTLWRYTGDGGAGPGPAPWDWEQLPSSAVQISRVDAGSMYIRRANGEVRQWLGTGWSAPLQMDGTNFCAAYIAAGSNGQLYALRCGTGSNLPLYRRNSRGVWHDMQMSGVQVTTVDSGVPYLRRASGALWYRPDGTWLSIGATVRWLATGPGPVLAVLANDATDMRIWTPGVGWEDAPGRVDDAVKQLTGKGGELCDWVLDPDGNLYRRSYLLGVIDCT